MTLQTCSQSKATADTENGTKSQVRSRPDVHVLTENGKDDTQTQCGLEYDVTESKETPQVNLH